jgi:hypothetical protein
MVLKSIFVLCLVAHAGIALGAPRGELLYATQCNACHETEIHWREQKQGHDWDSLKFQVRRWQKIVGSGWTEQEINDVTYYLNELYYGFPAAELLLQGEKQFEY